MSVYRRYFRVSSGPLIDELKRMFAQFEEYKSVVGKIAEEVGAEQEWLVHGSSFGGFRFKTQPDMKLWREVSGYDNMYYPRRTSKEGKALYERIKKAPERPDFNKALDVINVSGAWLNIDWNKMTHAGFVYLNPSDDTTFIQVPWRDVEPAKLEEYKAKRAAGGHREEELEHLLWTPHESMTEVKEWEYLKHKSDRQEKAAKEQQCQN